MSDTSMLQMQSIGINARHWAYSHTRLPLSGPQVIKHESQSSDHEVLVQHVEMRTVGSVFRHLLHGRMMMRFEHRPFSFEIEHPRKAEHSERTAM